MVMELERVRCHQCELVQWKDRVNCRRCGRALPEPVVQVLERVVEKIVVRFRPYNMMCPDQTCTQISTAADWLEQQFAQPAILPVPGYPAELGVFPTMAEVERAMIVAAYQRANRKPHEAARLLGIGKTTLYRKLKEMRLAPA